MAEFSPNKTRAVAIELKEHVLDLFFAVNAIYAEVSAWTVHCDPGALPDPFDIKTQLEAYAELQVKALQLTDWTNELRHAQFGDTLATLPPCEGTPSSGGLIVPDAGLTISDAGLVITGTEGPIGLTIPNTGLAIPDAGILLNT